MLTAPSLPLPLDTAPAAAAPAPTVAELQRALAEQSAKHRALEEYADQLEAVIDHAPLAIYLKDAGHRYLLVNRQYERLSAQRREDILGRDDFSLFPQPVAQLFRDQDLEVLRRSAPREFSETIPLPDGVHSFITSKFPVLSRQGSVTGVAGVCTEVTALERARAELVDAQESLVQKERLAALGELSAVVAHEVRNPLGVIFNAVGALRRTVGTTGPEADLLGLVQEEADRLNRIVGGLLELAGPTAPRFLPTSVAEVVASAVEAARGASRGDAGGAGDEVRIETEPNLPLAPLDEQLLQTAIANLVSNALAAPGRRGHVAVRVRREGSAVVIDVVDDGAGVPPALTKRIFEPFFTTRAKGTGLGLALVRRIAEAHGGAVSVRPTPGGGATFTLELSAAR